MKKKEMRMYAAQLVEIGKGFAYAENMGEGEAKTKALDLLNKSTDFVLTQLELICEDVNFNKVLEVTEYGEDGKHSA